MKTATEFKPCDMSDLGLSLSGEEAQSLTDSINDYLKDFTCNDGKCPKCGAKLGGMLGSFAYGIAHGEGRCTGGFSRKKCGWPCSALHAPKDSDGNEIFTSPIQAVLPYHPSVVSESK